VEGARFVKTSGRYPGADLLLGVMLSSREMLLLLLSLDLELCPFCAKGQLGETTDREVFALNALPKSRLKGE
jgi:hypothetical protein